MTFATAGGIEWEKDTATKTLTIRPAETPWGGYAKGQMADYENYGYSTPWGQITESGWSMKFLDGVTVIGRYAFYYCSGFTCEIVIPDSVKEIHQGAFMYCTNASGMIHVGKGIAKVGIGAFQGCRNVVGVTFHSDSPPSMEKRAFQLCAWDPFKLFKAVGVWPDPNNFPGYEYVGWQYISIPRSVPMLRDDDGNWTGCISYRKVNNVWLEALPNIKDEGKWK